jgi:photosystem II stability/assembly factor-like uncharacterized protein
MTLTHQLTIFLAAADGVVQVQHNGKGWIETGRGLHDTAVTCVTGRRQLVLAGSREGVFRSADFGQTWQSAEVGPSNAFIRWLAFHPGEPALALAGTEPAGIFVSADDGGTWTECPEVAAMRQQHRWSLPYSPEAGCVRGFAFSGSRGYAAVEDGGVLVTEDRGWTWQLAGGSRGNADHHPAAGGIHSDLHSIETIPGQPDLVFASTGGGFYQSRDGGASWTCLYPDAYTRAAWIDPQDPDIILLGPAEGVDFRGRVEASLDGGKTWQPADSGLGLPWRHHMVERFTRAGSEILAVLSNGEVFSASQGGRTNMDIHWKKVFPAIEDIAAAAAVQVD